MAMVNMLEAKASLSRLVEAVECGAVREIVIARNGKPTARLVPLAQEKPVGVRLGLLADNSPVLTLEDFNSDDEEIAAMFFLAKTHEAAKMESPKLK